MTQKMSQQVKDKIVKMTSETYSAHCDEDHGVCTSCGAIRFDFTESDAENYKCNECGNNSVQGMEQALLTDHIELIDDDDDEDDDDE